MSIIHRIMVSEIKILKQCSYKYYKILKFLQVRSWGLLLCKWHSPSYRKVEENVFKSTLHRFGCTSWYQTDLIFILHLVYNSYAIINNYWPYIFLGNGVQDAYSLSRSVFTLSFHKYEPGFYPGTGSIDDIGTQGGIGYTCNFPLHAAYSDDTMEYAFERLVRYKKEVLFINNLERISHLNKVTFNVKKLCKN